MVELLNSLFVGTSFTPFVDQTSTSIASLSSEFFCRKLVWFSKNWFCLGFGRDPSLDSLLLILKPEHSSIISLLILTMLYRFNSRIWHHIQVYSQTIHSNVLILGFSSKPIWSVMLEWDFAQGNDMHGMYLLSHEINCIIYGA